MNDVTLKEKEIKVLMNELKIKSNDIFNVIKKIKEWWIKNVDYLGYEIGSYYLKYYDGAIASYVIKYKYDCHQTIGGTFGRNDCADMKLIFDFLDRFPKQLKEHIINIIEKEEVILYNIDEIIKMILSDITKDELE
jgi:hypothetical protein